MEDVWAFMGSAGVGNDDFELLQAVPMREGVVGTDASCELCLKDPMLTPRHARVVRQDGRWFVGGIAVAAQTTVNGVATIPGQAVRLSVGDIVKMGSARFRFGGEPPARHPVDPADEAAVLIWADELAEAGDQLGARILEGHEPAPGWLPCDEDLVAERRIVPEWTRGSLSGLTVREISLATLTALLADPAAVALERLTVFFSTIGSGAEGERARSLLQVVAATKPPRLRQLELGWLHQETRLSGAALDWETLARRLPLAGTVQQAFRRAGLPRLTMLRGAPWLPPVGTTVDLREAEVEFHNPDHDAELRGFVRFFARQGSGMEIGCEDGLQINGAPGESHRVLVHGDLIEAPDFAFRFEES